MGRQYLSPDTNLSANGFAVVSHPINLTSTAIKWLDHPYPELLEGIIQKPPVTLPIEIQQPFTQGSTAQEKGANLISTFNFCVIICLLGLIC